VAAEKEIESVVEDAIKNYCQASIIEAGDYIENEPVTGHESDEEIQVMSDKLEDEAEREDVQIDGDLYDSLIELRDRAQKRNRREN